MSKERFNAKIIAQKDSQPLTFTIKALNTLTERRIPRLPQIFSKRYLLEPVIDPTRIGWSYTK